MANYWLVWSGGDNAGTGQPLSGLSASVPSATDWSHAYQSVPALISAQAIAGGDTIVIEKTHAYSVSGTLTWGIPEAAGATGNVTVLVVDKSASNVLSSGAVEESGSNTAPVAIKTNTDAAAIASSVYIHGMTFRAGAGGSTAGAQIQLNQGTQGKITFSNCTFIVNNSNSGSHIFLGSNVTATNGWLEFYNCTFKFGATTQRLIIGTAVARFYNCSLDDTGSAPAGLFASTTTSKGLVECYGCNWSKATTLLDVSVAGGGEVKCVNCATASTTLTTGTHAGINGIRGEFIGCGPADAGNGPDTMAYTRVRSEGTVTVDRTVYLTTSPSQGSWSDGTGTSYSLKFTPSATCSVYNPLYGPWVERKIAASGSKTISVKFADTESAALKDSELGIEVCYLGGSQLANSPQSQLETTAPVLSGTIYRDPTAAGSAMTDTNAAWTGVSENQTYTISKTVTVDFQGYVLIRGALYKQTTNPVYMDGAIGVS